MTKTTPLLALGVFLAILPSCGGGGGGKTKRPPLPSLKSIIEYSTPQTQYALKSTDTYPKRLASIAISHKGTVGKVSFALQDASGALRTNPLRGVLLPGETHTVVVEAAGLSYASVTLTLTCIYVDHSSTDQLDIPFQFVTNGGSFPGKPIKELITITAPTKLRHLLTPTTKFPLDLDFLVLQLAAEAIIAARFEVTDPLGNLLPRPVAGRLEPGGAPQRVDFAAIRSQFGLSRLSLVVRYDLVGKTDEYRQTWDVRNASPPNLGALIATNLFSGRDPVVPTRFWPGLTLDPIGVVVKHPMGAPRDKIPTLLYTEIGLAGSLNVDLTTAKIGKAFWRDKTTRGTTTGEALFPPGQGRNGFTIHAEKESPMPAGGYLVFHMTMERSIPLVDTVKADQHLYILAVDSDLKSANNWTAPTGLPNDPHIDTDRWYEIRYNDSGRKGAWMLRVFQLDGTKKPIEVASAARAILTDNAIVLLIPSGEFGPVKPKWRAASFVHQGDLGVNPPYTWSGDTMPAVGQPLLLFR